MPYPNTIPAGTLVIPGGGINSVVNSGISSTGTATIVQPSSLSSSFSTNFGTAYIVLNSVPYGATKQFQIAATFQFNTASADMGIIIDDGTNSITNMVQNDGNIVAYRGPITNINANVYTATGGGNYDGSAGAVHTASMYVYYTEGTRGGVVMYIDGKEYFATTYGNNDLDFQNLRVSLIAPSTSSILAVTYDIGSILPLGSTGGISSGNNLGYAATVLLDNPEVYYRFSESSSNIAYDSSGNSNNGTYVNTPIFGAVSLVGDINDKCINTNNTSYITSSTLPNVSAFTIELVVQLAGGLTYSRIFATDVYNSSNGFCIVFNQGNADALPNGFNITFNTTGSNISNITVANSFAISQSKLHIAMSYDGTTLKFYVNGALAYSNTLSGTYKPSTSYSVVTIGNDPGGQSQFSGFLDEYALYNTVLSQTRIQAHAAACFGAR